MDEEKNLAFIFIVSLPFSLIILGFIFSNFSMFHSSIFYPILLSIGLFFLFLSLLSLKRLFAEIKYDLMVRKIHYRTIRDFYRYKMMMDPPDWDT